MPILANAKQELYCKHRANGFIPKKAAVAAGYATGSAIYSGLEEDALVVARIAELLDERQAAADARRQMARESARTAGQLTGIGVAWVIEQLKENAEDARTAGDFKESNAALKMIGDHLGMFKPAAPADGDGAGPALGETLDFDALERLTRATDHLDDIDPPGLEVVSKDLVMGLIEGHQVTPGALARERRLETGSETDVALTLDDDDDDEGDDA